MNSNLRQACSDKKRPRKVDLLHFTRKVSDDIEKIMKQRGMDNLSIVAAAM